MKITAALSVLALATSALAIAATPLAPVAHAQALERRPDCLRIAIPLDVSGSMRAYFPQAQDALIDLLNTLRPCDQFHVIPFSETKREGLSRELTPENRAAALAEATAFVRGLRPGGRKSDSFGHWTNLDEGVDAATLALLREDDRRKGIIALLSDGLSDPDPQHKPVDLAELGRRIPRGAFNLYLVDLSGRETPGLEQSKVGSFEAGRVGEGPVVVIPLQRVEDLRGLLRELESRGRAEQEKTPAAPIAAPIDEPGEKTSAPGPLWPALLWALPVVAGAVLIVMILLRRRRPDSTARPGRRMLIRLDGEERRYSLPASLAIGGGEHDELRVRGARAGELRLRIGTRGDGTFRLNGERGGFFGSRTFTLSNGAAVEVRVETIQDRTLATTHRYLANSGEARHA